MGPSLLWFKTPVQQRAQLEIKEPVQLLKIKFRLLKMLVWKEALVSIGETNSMASCPISDSYQIKSLMEAEKGL